MNRPEGATLAEWYKAQIAEDRANGTEVAIEEIYTICGIEETDDDGATWYLFEDGSRYELETGDTWTQAEWAEYLRETGSDGEDEDEDDEAD